MKVHLQCYESCTSIENIKKCIEDGHSVLVLMRGVPGSGKSTIAKSLIELSKASAGLICSTDDYFMKSGEYKFDVGQLDNYHKKNQSTARDAMQNDITPIIVDNTNITIQEMTPYTITAATHFYEIYVIEPKNEWSRKAGQCALKNSHSVPKEKIDYMLGKMDLEHAPTLEKLVKGHVIRIQPPKDMEEIQENAEISLKMEIKASSGHFDIDQTSVVSMFSLAPEAKSKYIEMRHISCQTNEIIISLNNSGLEDIFNEVEVTEAFNQERKIVQKENKERTSQFPIDLRGDTEKAAAKKNEELDILVSIYPGEDMATILHYYTTFGLIGAIKNYCDMGIWPDFDADLILGSFNYDIAKAIETGSFEHNARTDGVSYTNTTTTSSNDDELGSTLLTVDVGKTFWEQLQFHFGPAPYPNAPTEAQIPINILRQIYNAVLVQQAINPHEQSDAAYAWSIYENENRVQPSSTMNIAQRLSLNKLYEDFPDFNRDNLRNFYIDSKCNDKLVRESLCDNGHKPMGQRHFSFVSKVSNYKLKDIPGTSNNEKFASMERAQNEAKELIEEANELKKKKDMLLRKNYYNKHIKSNYDTIEIRQLKKKENELRERATKIIIEANENSKGLDFHFLSPKDALNLLANRIELLQSQKHGHAVYLSVITGHGKHRDGGGKVKQAITSWLNNKKYSYSAENEGCLKVIIK